MGNIIGIGIDIEENKRMQKIVDQDGKRFLNSVFTENELKVFELVEEKAQYLSSRFAAKEAVMKAFGIPMKWKDMEIMNDDSGKPYVTLLISDAEIMKHRNVKQIFITISHSKDYAIANVLLEGVDDV